MYPESKCHFLLQILMDFDYFSYSLDMESIDFHLFFVHIKPFMGG